MLPDSLRAVRTAVIAVAGIIVLSLVYPTEAPGHSYTVEFWPGVAHCLWFVVRMWIGAFLIFVFAIRKLTWVSSWRVGAAIGASAGALSGLVLYFLCPYADRWHVATAHGGGVAVCAILSAAIVSRL